MHGQLQTTGLRPPLAHSPAPLATRPVLLISGVLAAVLAIAGSRYGYFGDELYFLAAGDHLSWGYADQQPVLPLLALAMDALFPGSPLGLRLPAILLTAAGVVVAALIAREFGGDQRAQVLSAAVFAICPQLVAEGRLLATSAVDPILWAVLTWLLVRWVRLRDDRLLLWAGATTALLIQVKFLIAGFWLVAIVAVLVLGPRSMLRRPRFWGGAAIALAATVPTLIWQAANGWPQLGMVDVVAGESAATGTTLLPGALYGAGPVGAVLLGCGLWWLLRAPRLRPFRFVAATFLGLAVLFIVVGARSYYLTGLYPVVWAASAVGLRPHLNRRAIRWATSAACAVSAVVALSALTPRPLSAELPGTLPNIASSGWPEFTRDVADALHDLPAEEQVAVVASSYWSASAIQHLGPEEGIPEVYSGSRGYWYFGSPPEGTRTALFVGFDEETLRRHFGHVEQVSTVDGPGAINRGTPIWLAEDPHLLWRDLWPQFRYMHIGLG
ncbi:glycosyltransferase family 39 protein [Saccharopolyspora indica]|uniref:glycosyltransferase family 39 protein n=1 Tax=Saccharopolyspora indica TaxID=1229659 RepID=UPI0022EA3245|nr:glycosyltransferase family 39 protein [Saccharopolyspora indica]MDA3644887.1 glycosyltransferase family 39 protein [Saccharopolyspora indica]